MHCRLHSWTNNCSVRELGAKKMQTVMQDFGFLLMLWHAYRQFVTVCDKWTSWSTIFVTYVSRKIIGWYTSSWSGPFVDLPYLFDHFLDQPFQIRDKDWFQIIWPHKKVVPARCVAVILLIRQSDCVLCPWWLSDEIGRWRRHTHHHRLHR